MANSLFNSLGQPTGTGGMGNLSNVVNQFNQFRKTFTGDPRQQIQQMLTSGRISQEQLNQAAQTANQLMRLMKQV